MGVSDKDNILIKILHDSKFPEERLEQNWTAMQPRVLVSTRDKSMVWMN